MRAPSQRGAPIDARRYRRWTNRFGAYRDPVTNVTIDSWFENFKTADKDLASRILDAVDFYGQSQIHAAYREALAALFGWNEDPAQRTGKWAFAAMSGSAGESGDAMLYQFRIANGLDARRYNSIFLSRSDLFHRANLPDDHKDKLGKNDVVVLLDDFTGTGEQVCKAWNDPGTSFGALLAGIGKIYLIVVAAGKGAPKRIADETTLTLIAAHHLHDSDNVFSSSCRHFDKSDRDKLLIYGKKADKKYPQGRGECGLLVVFQHRSPNNTLPILHRDTEKWTGLFPRHD